MAQSVGLLECDSIPRGYLAADAAAKAAAVSIALASPICPGRFFLIVTGRTAAVQAAMEWAVAAAKDHVLSHGVLANISDAVVRGLAEPDNVLPPSALGVIETVNARAAILGADAAAKGADVQVLEVRVTRGMGGKSLAVLAGTVDAVQAAVASAKQVIDAKDLVSAVVLTSPHPAILAQFPG